MSIASKVFSFGSAAQRGIFFTTQRALGVKIQGIACILAFINHSPIINNRSHDYCNKLAVYVFVLSCEL